MAKRDIIEKIELPQGTTASLEGGSLSIKGPKGTITRKYESPKVKLEVKPQEITLSSKSAGKLEKAILFSYRAHLMNSVHGVSSPYVYKLKICSGHFPMNVSVTGNELVIKNFLGEKVPRKIRIKPDATVKVEGNMITVQAPSKETAGQVAADIEQGTRRPGFDERIFQDGIYIIEKAGKAI